MSRLLATVLLATALTACSSFERSGREDTRITRNVISELRNEPHLDVSGIRVETDNGTVQLSGTVKSQDEKERAGRVAREVNGVKRVENDLKVR